MAGADSCFHCALPIPAGCELQILVDGSRQPVCCPGCKAVAELILASGLENYYELRDAPLPGTGRPEAMAAEWQAFDRADMRAAFTETDGESCAMSVYVAGMYCSACSWLIETSLARIAGIEKVDVDPITHRARVNFDAQSIGPATILSALADLGYKPQALTPHSATRPELSEQRAALKRLLVASLGMMQVMMFAVALYAGEFQGIDATMQRFLRFVSLLVTTPVVFYAARPFFTAAVRGLRSGKPGMDLPVSIAIGSAYAASLYATFVNGPAVWFDSVTMFVFFLTLGRFLEMRARHRSASRSVALSSVLPNTVTRIEESGHKVVAASALVAGDRVLVRQGEAFPADGVLLHGAHLGTAISVDEALLTGESHPQRKIAGDPVVAGSILIDGLAEMQVNATGVDTTLGTIARLSEKARYARPEFVQLADRIAGYVVFAVLAVATSVAIVWAVLDPDRAFVITLSVLVVTCPCALALATPAAFAAAGSRLSELRLLLTNANAIEPLARASKVIFDKTGTLTFGRPTVVSTEVLDETVSERRCLQIAATLESASTHPIAAAFTLTDLLDVADLQNVVGSGVSGTVDGDEWRLGKATFTGIVGNDAAANRAVHHSGLTVWLANQRGPVARFSLDDDLRPDAIDSIDALKSLGLSVAILSGDSAAPVKAVAERLGIDDYHAELSPEDKLTAIRAAQQDAVVIMVGDGINDAPVLAGADASIAPARAAKLAQTGADLVMMGDSLRPIVTTIRLSRQTLRIVRQNLSWAIIYNATALPLAALGHVPPWLAAIGMSASSLIVVLNALRLGRFGRER